MLTQNIMLKNMLASISATINLHIIDVPDITYLTNIYTTSAPNKTNPPTYEHLHRHLLIQNEPKNKTVPYKKIFMALTKMVNACCLLGKNNLVQVFFF